jgi:hypothetical protein
MSIPQTRPCAPAPAAANLAPLGKTQRHLTVWAVPGREPGQTIHHNRGCWRALIRSESLRRF